MEYRESVGIIGNDDGLIRGICTSNGFDVWSCKRRSTKYELRRRINTCRVIVFAVEDEEEYQKEAKKRHVLIGNIREMDNRIEVVCVIKESLCTGKNCKMKCTKVTCRNESFSRLRSEFEHVFRRVELKCW